METKWQFYRRLLTRLPRHLIESADLMGNWAWYVGVGIAAIALLFNKPIVDALAISWAGLNPLWGLVPLALLVSRELLDENFAVYSSERQRADAAEARLVPRLTMFVDLQEEPACFQQGAIPAGYYRLARVIIANHGIAAVTGQATIRRIPPTSIDRVPLQIMHDRSEPRRSRFEIPAQDRILIDVVEQIDYRPSSGHAQSQICYASNERGPIPDQPTTIEIVVGGDVQPLSGRFAIEFDSEGNLLPLRQAGGAS